MSQTAADGNADAVDPGPSQAAGQRATRQRRIELVAVILLSTTTILTAWTAFQASKWGGAMSISFSQASSARIESAKLDGKANVRQSNQISLWTEWVSASGAGDKELATFLRERFPEPLATAQRAWIADGGFNAPSDQSSPFVLPEYVVPEAVEAEAASKRADGLFQTALDNNQRSDNYTILTVLFASVLFFAAMSGRIDALRSQVLLLVLASALGLVGFAILLSYPRLI